MPRKYPDRETLDPKEPITDDERHRHVERSWKQTDKNPLRDAGWDKEPGKGRDK